MTAISRNEFPIVVLADDLSGAAELAGIACANGLTAEVQRQLDPLSKAHVIAVDSNTRSVPEADAVLKVQELARQVMGMQPAWIYKKVDSLLRGHPWAEIEAVLAVTGFERSVLIPANPSRGRTIRDGTYLIDGVPLDQTSLARDPDHPRWSARVRELLGQGGVRVHCVTSTAVPPADGIIVPDTSEVTDIDRWVSQIDQGTLPAGAADFFTALLRGRMGSASPSPQLENLSVRLPALLVCGSRASWQTRTDECRRAGVPIVMMNELPSTAAARLSDSGALLLAIGGNLVLDSERGRLMSTFADFVAVVLKQTAIATILLEGGATAEAVAQRLGWSRFAVCAPGPAGVGILQPITDNPAPRVLMKPGSYPWPTEIWQALLATEC